MTKNNVEQLNPAGDQQQKEQYNVDYLINNLVNANVKLTLENAELKAIIQTENDKKEGY